ncbi:hypothetical protein O3G_MSEX001658 [Manduca sexta]|uniref:Uncharacterized protein n=1 Tax=Manduca sexta TaxID=7130 RepID=A0A922CCL2_MANSE|nr:hypothetical protein O3G_MSEX001658 [Manduca sexta]
MPREKSKHRERRSSSYSSEASYDRKKSKSKHKRRSRSKDRSESNYRRKRSISRSRHRRRSYSRSLSRDRYEKSKKRSSSRRERSRSISSSRSRSKHNHVLQSFAHLSLDPNLEHFAGLRKKSLQHKRVNHDDTESKLEKAIKAAAAAGLTMTKIPTYEYKEVEIKEDMPTIHDRNLLAEINSDSFVQKPFISSKSKKQSQNIVIDLDAQTVKVPQAEIKVQKDDSIINFDELPSEEELKEMWIQKLYQYRKKMLRGEI